MTLITNCNCDRFKLASSIVLSWYHHQPESHQQSFTKSRTYIETPGPIDRTPETPGSGKKNRESTQSCFHYGSVFCFCVHCCLLNDTDIADSRDEEREEKLGNVNKAAISTVKDTKSFSIFILTPKELLHCNGWTKLNAGCFNENFHLSDECADAKCQPEKDDLIGNGTLGVRTSTSITVQQYLKYHGPKSICVFGKIYKVQEILHTSIYVSGISIPISISGL